MPNTGLYENERPLKALKRDWIIAYKGSTEIILRAKTRDRYIPNMNQYQKQRERNQITVCIIGAEPIPMRFKRLLAEWKEQTAHMSYSAATAMLLSYQQIIGMGEPVLPLILTELKERPAHLFWALRAISGVDPVLPEDRGDINKMIEAWINWGQHKRII